MTQRHYVDSVRTTGDLDPQFASLLRHHWMEEAQHAKLDTLMVESLTEACGKDEIDGAIDEYVQIGGLLDGGLQQQMEFDLDAFERATGSPAGPGGARRSAAPCSARRSAGPSWARA